MIIHWTGNPDQVQRIATRVLVGATVNAMELGLRWMHDVGRPRVGDPIDICRWTIPNSRNEKTP